METLLVVLVIGCALALAVHVGRGVWYRARSVERHQQALDTLAGITNRSDVVSGSAASPGPVDEPHEHQAHVRLIGPAGQANVGDSAALPPPRATSALGPTSPFRRPSRTSPSAAAMDAVATTAYLARSPGDNLVRTGTPPHELRQPPAQLPADATLPGLVPEQAPYVEPPTRPVPIVQPQVFYFDDLSTRGDAPTSPAHAGPSRTKLRRRDRRRARRQHAKADEFEGAGHTESTAPAVPPAGAPQPAGAGPVDARPVDLGPVDLKTVDPGAADLGTGLPKPFVSAPFAPEALALGTAFHDPAVTAPVFRAPGVTDAPTVLPERSAVQPPAPSVAETVVHQTGSHQTGVPDSAARAALIPEAVAPAAGAAAGAGAVAAGAVAAGAAPATGSASAAATSTAAGHDTAPSAEGETPKKKPSSRSGRKSVLGVVLAAAAICVALAAIGITLLGLPGQGSTHNLSAGTTTPTSTSPHETTTSFPPTPTTNPAPPKPAILLSASGGTATYELRSPSASIVVSATGPCWLEVRANSPLGQIIYEGILYAGQYSKVTGPAWIRLGNPPAVAVKVDGTVMSVPGAQSAVPLNLQFTFG